MSSPLARMSKFRIFNAINVLFVLVFILLVASFMVVRDFEVIRNGGKPHTLVKSSAHGGKYKNELKQRDKHKYLFVGGVHRTGTTRIVRILGKSPAISFFHGTSASKNEGMHLQTVYPTDWGWKKNYGCKPHDSSCESLYGGPGNYGFHRGAYLSRDSEFATPANKLKLWRQWRPYWNMSKPILVEKSPPNIIRGLFLEEMFWSDGNKNFGGRNPVKTVDGDYGYEKSPISFIFLIRHPLAAAKATYKWNKKRTVAEHVDHTLRNYEQLREDVEKLRSNFKIIFFEHYMDLDWTLTMMNYLGRWQGDPHLYTKWEVNDRTSKYSTKLVGSYANKKYNDVEDYENGVRQDQSLIKRIAMFGYDMANMEFPKGKDQCIGTKLWCDNVVYVEDLKALRTELGADPN